MTVARKILVGLVGENDNDTAALTALLLPRFGDGVQFVRLGRRITGDQLANKNDKARKVLEADFAKANVQLVVVSRDLDALAADAKKVAARQQEFEHFNQHAFGGCGLLLLHIYELEALIAAEPTEFNRRYNVAYKPKGNVMHLERPKDKLKSVTGHRYHEAHAALLLEKADYDALLARCGYFAAFDGDFSARLAVPRPHDRARAAKRASGGGRHGST